MYEHDTRCCDDMRGVLITIRVPQSFEDIENKINEIIEVINELKPE